MSDYGDLFTNFYNQFILRDLLSIVLPGFIVIVTTLFFIEGRFPLKKIFSNDISFLSIFLILGFSYILGIFFLYLSDMTGFCKTYYTKKPKEMKIRTKAFHEKLENGYWYKDRIKGNFAKIRERYIIFMQASGNMAWAMLTLLTIIGIFAILIQNIDFFWIILIFLFLFCLSSFSHYHYKKYLKEWDDVIMDC